MILLYYVLYLHRYNFFNLIKSFVQFLLPKADEKQGSSFPRVPIVRIDDERILNNPKRSELFCIDRIDVAKRFSLCFIGVGDKGILDKGFNFYTMTVSAIWKLKGLNGLT